MKVCVCEGIEGPVVNLGHGGSVEGAIQPMWKVFYRYLTAKPFAHPENEAQTCGVMARWTAVSSRCRSRVDGVESGAGIDGPTPVCFYVAQPVAQCTALADGWRRQ